MFAIVFLFQRLSVVILCYHSVLSWCLSVFSLQAGPLATPTVCLRTYDFSPSILYSLKQKVVFVLLTLSFPHFFRLWPKSVYQSVQHYTGLTHHFYFFDILALWLSARVPECQKINNGELDHYGPENSEV